MPCEVWPQTTIPSSFQLLRHYLKPKDANPSIPQIITEGVKTTEKRFEFVTPGKCYVM